MCCIKKKKKKCNSKYESSHPELLMFTQHPQSSSRTRKEQYLIAVPRWCEEWTAQGVPFSLGFNATDVNRAYSRRMRMHACRLLRCSSCHQRADAPCRENEFMERQISPLLSPHIIQLFDSGIVTGRMSKPVCDGK